MPTLEELVDLAFDDLYSSSPMVPVDRLKKDILAGMARQIREQNEDYKGESAWRRILDREVLDEADRRGV